MDLNLAVECECGQNPANGWSIGLGKNTSNQISEAFGSHAIPICYLDNVHHLQESFSSVMKHL